MDISFDRINDNACYDIYVRRETLYEHKSDLPFFGKSRVLTEERVPQDVVRLMRACETDRVGTDFFGVAHPLTPSASYELSRIREKAEDAVRMYTMAAEEARQRARLEEAREMLRLRRIREQEMTRRQAEALIAVGGFAARRLSRLFR